MFGGLVSENLFLVATSRNVCVQFATAVKSNPSGTTVTFEKQVAYPFNSVAKLS